MEVRKRACPIECSSRAPLKKPKVGAPVSVMFYDRGEWREFGVDVSGALRRAFLAGNRVVQLVMNSCLYVISFMQMLQIDANTGCSRSIAWVNDSGEFQHPPSPVDGIAAQGNVVVQSPKPVAVPGKVAVQSLKPVKGSGKVAVQSSYPVSPVVGSKKRGSVQGMVGLGKGGAQIALSARKASSGEISSVSSQGDTVGEGFMDCGKKLKRLEVTDSAYASVRKVFLDGLGMFADATQVTGVYEVSYEGIPGSARKEAFERATVFTEKARGVANVRRAWYGCSRDELRRIVQHGFGRPTSSTYGVGVYLTPEKFSRLSCISADVDDKGEQHILFCQVILGSSERVEAGSKQFHPSSESFDTGVDSLVDPKRFVVWSTHMNTHILPLYVASFKLPREWHEIKEASGEKPVPIGIRSGVIKSKNDKAVAVPKLFSVLKPELSATDMCLLQKSYTEFKNGRLSREDFLRKVRSLAGDQLLKRLQEQIVGNSLLCSFFLQGKLMQMTSKRSVAG